MAEPRKYQSVFRSDLFRDHVVFVTGGGTGLGRCTAHELASLGAHVVIAGRRQEPLESTAAEIAATGGSCSWVQIDVRDEISVERAVTRVLQEHARIDGLVNNAGGQFVSMADQMSANGWRSVIDLNLNGTFLVSREVYRQSMRERGGAIVSMLADIWTGYPGMSHMAAARAGIENLTRTLALEWCAAGVRVNCVAPGTILSSGMHRYPREVQERTAKGSEEIAAARLGTESEVSAGIVFLLSPAAAYITGETLCIDGGAQFQKGRFVRLSRHDKFVPFNGFHLRPDFTGTPFEGM
jgi:citronellol/citronellal dehydrogenase